MKATPYGMLCRTGYVLDIIREKQYVIMGRTLNYKRTKKPTNVKIHNTLLHAHYACVHAIVTTDHTDNLMQKRTMKQ